MLRHLIMSSIKKRAVTMTDGQAEAKFRKTHRSLANIAITILSYHWTFFLCGQQDNHWPLSLTPIVIEASIVSAERSSYSKL